MSKIANYRKWMAILFLALCTGAESLNAQESTPAKPASANSIGDRCESQVRPIKRVRQSAKPVVDWTTMASTYSHDTTGQRVDQYATEVTPVAIERSDFARSGYRHSRSSLQTGFSSDHYHVVEQWGQPVQPYGEWRYPNRPFSVPYGQWGPQLPQVVGGVYGQGFNRPPFGGPNWQGGPIQGNGNQGNAGQFHQGFGNQGFGFGVGPGNALQAGQDEYYQQAPLLRSN
jgi:hypothetical protein